jgi:hypothetical protein
MLHVLLVVRLGTRLNSASILQSSRYVQQIIVRVAFVTVAVMFRRHVGCWNRTVVGCSHGRGPFHTTIPVISALDLVSSGRVDIVAMIVL